MGAIKPQQPPNTKKTFQSDTSVVCAEGWVLVSDDAIDMPKSVRQSVEAGGALALFFSQLA